MGRVMEPDGAVVLPQDNTFDLTLITRQLELNAEVLMEIMTKHAKKLMVENTGWIRLDDRKPPNDCYVLVAVWHHHKSHPMHHISIAKRMNSEWFDDHDEEPLLGKSCIVTHWMPLPDKPSKDDL